MVRYGIYVAYGIWYTTEEFCRYPLKIPLRERDHTRRTLHKSLDSSTDQVSESKIYVSPRLPGGSKVENSFMLLLFMGSYKVGLDKI